MLQILTLLAGTILPEPSLADLLEGGAIGSWTVEEMLLWESRLTRDGLPLLVLDEEPPAGWGSFEGAVLRNPVEAGVWAGGGWQLDLVGGEIPDSSYASGIGLIENTEIRSRYSAFLRRPVPLGMGIDLSIDREDTLGNQRVLLARGPFSLGARSWQTSGRGTVVWGAWSPGDFTGRASFGRLRSGDRRWELLGSLAAAAGPLAIEAGAAGSLANDTLLAGEGHLRVETPLAGMLLIARADVEDLDGEVSTGGTAGISAQLGPVRTVGGLVSPPGARAGLFLSASLWRLTGSLLSDDGLSGGLDLLFPDGPLLLRAGLAAGGDSILFRGTAMPSIRWGASGRIHAGASWELADRDGEGGASGTMDLKVLLVLDRFAFITAAEDVLDDWRSYSFGISWAFDDDPPALHEEDGE